MRKYPERNRQALWPCWIDRAGGRGRSTGPLIAPERGDVDVQHVWRLLRAQKIGLAARRSWCESHDPEFAAKAAEILGLYLDPPDGALGLAVDEKPRSRCWSAQGYRKLPNGRALTDQSHEDTRAPPRCSPPATLPAARSAPSTPAAASRFSPS